MRLPRKRWMVVEYLGHKSPVVVAWYWSIASAQRHIDRSREAAGPMPIYTYELASRG